MAALWSENTSWKLAILVQKESSVNTTLENSKQLKQPLTGDYKVQYVVFDPQDCVHKFVMSSYTHILPSHAEPVNVLKGKRGLVLCTNIARST